MMKKSVQYYDSKKGDQISVEDLAIDIGINLPNLIAQFGAENVAIYVDYDTRIALKSLGVDSNCIKAFQPLDDLNHSVRWLSVLAQQTEPFQISPIAYCASKRDVDQLEVSELVESEYIPVLDQLGIEQVGGICGGDIINIPNCNLSRHAYSSARDIIFDKIDNDIELSEYECSLIMGAMLYKFAREMGIVIVKYP